MFTAANVQIRQAAFFLFFLKESAFYVGVTVSTVPPETNKLPFAAVFFSNYTSPYSVVTNTFSVSQRSLYWFQLCVGVPAYTSTYNQINGLDYPTVIYSIAAVYPMDRLSIDTIQWVSPAVSLTVSNNQALFSSSNLETAWLGFRLDNTFSPLIAFDVQLTHYDSSIENGIAINFDRVLVNEGNSYYISNNTFVVPLDGSYFFSIITPNGAHITVNSNITLNVCVCDTAHGNAIGSARASAMMTLNRGDIVRAKALIAGLNITGNENGLTNFRGFLYSPLTQRQVAWSVVRTVAEVNYAGPIDYLPHNIVYTNINGPWLINSNIVIIPVTGTYFIDITSYLCGTVSEEGDGNCETNVMLNGSPIIIIRLSLATFANCVSRSRSTIVKLKVNDELWVKIPTVGWYYNDDQRMQTFTGFLLY